MPCLILLSSTTRKLALTSALFYSSTFSYNDDDEKYIPLRFLARKAAATVASSFYLYRLLFSLPHLLLLLLPLSLFAVKTLPVVSDVDEEEYESSPVLAKHSLPFTFPSHFPFPITEHK